MPARLSAVVETALHGLAQPARARRLRQALSILLLLWAMAALSRLIWALLPASENTLPADLAVINPVSAPGPASPAAAVNLERMMAWHLFGEAGEPASGAAATAGAAQESALEGIEQGARETRLDLLLRGVVASTEEGLGHAIIEHKKRQDVYAVDDKLPVPGRVVLAKVMPQQVVLDNGGTYELLTLFDESQLTRQLPAANADGRGQQRRLNARPPVPAAAVDKRGDAGATALAQSYRERLYQNPQSLAEVVRLSAVREGGELLGYRIAPGKDREQFEQLGFKPGDLVTAVNGIVLNDPGNTMRLYQAMRSADEAVFDLRRNDQPLTVSVSLDSATAGP